MATAAKVDTREAILDACDQLMARYGFRKMTVDDIAKEAGISKRTIYLHFPSKEEIGLSSIDRVVGSALAEMRSLSLSSHCCQDKLRGMLIGRVMVRIDSVSRYAQSLDGLFEAVRPAYMDRRRLYFAAESDAIQEVLREGTDKGEFREMDVAATAEAILRATNAFLPYSLSVAEIGERQEIRSRLETMVDLLLRGLSRVEDRK